MPTPQPEDLERSFRADSIGSKDDIKVDDVDEVDTPKKDNRESLLTAEDRINNTEVTKSSRISEGVALGVPVGNNLTVPGKADLNETTTSNKVEESEFKQTWRLFNTKRMRQLCPLMIWSGISMATYQAAIVPLMVEQMPKSWSNEKQVELSTLAQIGLGVGEVVGGLINGEI